MPEAAMDSSARDPPPKCHPGTRVHIVSKLERLRDDPDRQWHMVWLHGPAGTGKSAVAQTFAELCAEQNRLGAAFFFSRPNKRDRPEKVIPTIAFQLAYYCPAYKSIITRILASDPHLLKKAMHVQFKQLIVRPFSQLQDQNHESVSQPFLVLLDGMDECNREDVQCNLIKMINDLVALRRRFPILWLICSRPEPHLAHTFLRLPDCRREELALDEKSRDDVEKFLRDGLNTLKDKFPHIIPSMWPDEEQLDVVLRFCSSLFAAASVVLNYVSDSAYANPVARLNSLVSFLERTGGAVGPSHPLISLDVLYTRILSEIPEGVYPTTQRILSYLVYSPYGFHWIESCQIFCNFLRLDQNTFYIAFHRLHSVLNIPAPEHAIDKQISFHHASFADFLRDANRSGKFFVDKGKAYVDMAKTFLFWHDLDARLFHTSDGMLLITMVFWSCVAYPLQGLRFNLSHKHDKPLPDLTWASANTSSMISQKIENAADWFFEAFDEIEKMDIKDEKRSSPAGL
ncbi:hypothetical protein AN958_00671 [Leucoagaricus sp. SymC.cos]|nr:hypothetical protein AN958_00671 [Leucoagaricus sp. SymC.cos]